MNDGPYRVDTKATRPEVFIGRTFAYDVVVYDGEDTNALPYGATVDISSASVSGELTIQNPDGTADLTVVATKVDKKGSGYVDTFRFLVAKEVTALWSAQLADFLVDYIDSNGSIKIVIQIGEVDILADPTDVP